MDEAAEMKDRWREPAELLRRLGHPLRLALLEDLLKGPRCVTDLQDLLGVRQANMSQHLGVLRQTGLVDYHEEGAQRCYYLCRPALARTLLQLAREEYPLEPLSKAEVKRRAEARRREEGTACAAASVQGKENMNDEGIADS